jgi:predicted nucleotidyltransferase
VGSRKGIELLYNKQKGKAMDERDRALILEFKRRLPVEVIGHLRKIIIFGSRVRGEATEESDLDVIALVDEKTPEIEKQHRRF